MMKNLQNTLQTRLLLWLSFSLLTVALLATLWEFKLEGLVLPALDISYDEHFEIAERWRFVLTSTGFAVLSLIIPGWIIRTLLLSLSANYLELIKVQEETQRLARHDPMTGLMNRRMFMEHLEHSLASGAQTAVLLIDLDKFKPINDAYGHAMGDEVLCEIAERLRAFISRRATIARLGGDEFAIVLNDYRDKDELAALARAINVALSLPLSCAPSHASTTVSIGIACSPGDALEADLLLKCADTAMYHGKRAGRGTYHFYEASFGEAEHARERFEQDILDGIRLGQFSPYFQPIVDLKTQAISGFEMLARWHHPTRGLLMPLEFIADVERIGAMPAMTDLLLTASCRIAKSWPDHLILAINVSASMIEDLKFPERLRNKLKEEDFPCSRLEVEITEDALISNISVAKTNLGCLKALGISIALDDFGTGYSGLYHLTQLSIDKIKIDRSFITLEAANKDQMMSAILDMGKSLGMRVTAEGVEQMPMAEWLALHGCDFAQGYLFGKPVPEDGVSSLFNSDALKELGNVLGNPHEAQKSPVEVT
jgi:diguanylate cyclase (GGDEF)-like protein